MEVRLREESAESLFVGGECSAEKGDKMLRITSELDSSYWVAARRTPPKLLPGRFRQIEIDGQQVYVNRNSLKKRLRLGDEADGAAIQARLQLIRDNHSSKANAKAIEYKDSLQKTPQEEALLESLPKTSMGIIVNSKDRGKRYLIDRDGAGNVTTFIRLGKGLGEGGCGTVEAGVDLIHGKRVAVKSHNPDQEAALEDEFAAYQRMNDTTVQIVRTVSNTTRKRTAYLVMERMDGDLVDGSRKLSDKQKERVLVAMWDHLGQLHAQGIFHRDIKLENILYKIEENGEVTLKIVDPAFAVWQKEQLPEGCAGTTTHIKWKDVKQIYNEDGTIANLGLMQGMDLFALTVDTLRFLSEHQLSVGRNDMNTGRLSCSRDQFLRAAGRTRKMEKVWNTLVTLHAASLTERSESGKAKAVAQQLAQHLTETDAGQR